ncbi:glutaminyl-peptide cyclotransferase-like [Actinia tenebrosa]|uniref:Glutaminyl-peptide cyclotransferase n=1 Tax=Actinia tenebrosa TaxID=6105 RepID=A0A6P8I0R3_ACTTE|nr:glutaminyl-peptide cyclotransferase-like [Actinia tenebrosa]XP_031558469.1 glutaminyl-peptide cyclotransferase-like [Actinia tenebrosa]XP_031558470.1 glutaminyl-peptide cyclotransferase-like [Actinia tenebrosa]
MRYKIAFYLVALVFDTAECYISDQKLTTRTFNKPRSLPQWNITSLASLTNYDEFYGKILRPVLKVRVPQTPGHTEVRKFITKQFEDLKWSVTLDEFEADTPYGLKTFRNIIATLNPVAKTRHVMSAHYDSKLFKPDGNGRQFIGAIDSAVPCAMLIEVARTVTPFFRAKPLSNEVTLQMVFFDGEEAFKDWSPTDSIYGSRHLAQFWKNTADDLAPVNPFAPSVQPTLMDSVQSLILLDLLGAPDPKFFNMFEATSHLFEHLKSKEDALYQANQLEEYKRNKKYFQSVELQQIYIEDDHIPFLREGVPILHLIPVPFPHCWHQLNDDETCLRNSTIHNLIKILRLFTVELFEL